MKTVIEIEWKTDTPPEGVDLALAIKFGHITYISSSVYRFRPSLNAFDEYAHSDGRDGDVQLQKRDEVAAWALYPLGDEINPTTGEILE